MHSAQSTTKDTGAASESIPKETAVNWKDSYAPILDRYHEFTLRYEQSITDTDLDFFDWEEPWATMGSIYPMEKPLENFGYAIRDIDNNGTPELVLLGKSDLSISAIFTIVEGEPQLLGTYWDRNACFMDESDKIHTSWSNGAADSGQSIYHMASDGKSLELLETVGIESYSDTSTVQLDEPEYYIIKGSDKVIVSEEQAQKAWNNYPSNNDKSGLEFIPIITE